MAGAIMGVIPASTGRLGNKGIAPPAVRWYLRRPLFARAVYVRWNMQPMPVHDLRVASFIDDVDCKRLALRDAEQGTGSLTVISHGSNGAPGCQFESDLTDSQRDVCR